MRFTEFKFKPFINKALEKLQFLELKPIQEEVIPNILKGKNIIGQSETGSGKTHAFLLPIFQMIEPSNLVSVVITSPTRELAKQIYDAATLINDFRDNKLKIKLYVGGKDREKELAWLNNNQPDIVIGTPGRIMDLAIKERKLLVYQTKIYVVDEADMALEAGFLNEIDQVAGLMPKDLQMCVFSATIPVGIKPFLKKYMENPIQIDLTINNITPKNLTHYLIKTKGKDKFELLENLMTILNPYLSIIFANTKKEVDEIVEYLNAKNIRVGKIHGSLTSRERTKNMREIRELKYTYVVATDIASRGIDIEGVSHIINFSLPDNYEFYVHRSGRTSRNNLSGEVYSLYDFNDDSYLNQLDKFQIKFKNVEIRNNEIVEARDRNARKKFIKEVKTTTINLPKPKKVKPGYKKKLATVKVNKNAKNR